jgi:hypothetical protein
LVSFTRTADKKTTYSTFCRAIEFRADDTHSFGAIDVADIVSFLQKFNQNFSQAANQF